MKQKVLGSNPLLIDLYLKESVEHSKVLQILKKNCVYILITSGFAPMNPESVIPGSNPQ